MTADNLSEIQGDSETIDVINHLRAKADHLATQFGTESKIRLAYLRMADLCEKGISLEEALTIVEQEIDYPFLK